MFFISTAHGPNVMAPAPCCFKFFSKRIPKAEIELISKTHNRCSEKAFVYVWFPTSLHTETSVSEPFSDPCHRFIRRFDTPRGQICVRQSLDWAKKVYDELQRSWEKWESPPPAPCWVTSVQLHVFISSMMTNNSYALLLINKVPLNQQPYCDSILWWPFQNKNMRTCRN